MISFKNYFNKFDVEMSYRNPNTSQTSDEFHGKESISETECIYIYIYMQQLIILKFDNLF